jgi:hypothetical protein
MAQKINVIKQQLEKMLSAGADLQELAKLVLDLARACEELERTVVNLRLSR